MIDKDVFGIFLGNILQGRALILWKDICNLTNIEASVWITTIKHPRNILRKCRSRDHYHGKPQTKAVQHHWK